jgi:hypothetical protein
MLLVKNGLAMHQRNGNTMTLIGVVREEIS